MLLFGISGVSRQHEEFKRNKLRNGNGIEKVKEKYKDKDKEKKGNKKRVGGHNRIWKWKGEGGKEDRNLQDLDLQPKVLLEKV